MQYRYLISIITGFIFLLSTRCTGGGRTRFESPEGYDFSKPWQLNLPIELDEISGIAYYPKDTSVFAIIDEFGWLYKIHLTGNRQIGKWKFSDQGDYEDLAMIDSIFYALQSNGDIITFTFGDNHTVFKHDSQFPTKGNEFEILFYDSTRHKLSLICKDCDSDRKKLLTRFFFDPARKTYDDTTMGIDVKKVAIMMGEKNLKLKPSAAAIHPITGEIYIVSAVNDLLVITDQQGNPRITYRIDGKLFKQPEGIAFTPNGDLLISNEAAERGVANILLFKYHKKS
jgi:uncharacterized protein YjiK